MEKKAVVLSGGGSKGAYQVGVWKALRKLHYKYQIVTGTSVGALNGVMMVQKEYQKCLNLWENMNFSILFDESFPQDVNGIVGKTKVYHKYAKSFLKNGGMNTSRFEQLVYQLFHPFRFFHSNVDFGIVTYNLSSRKAIEVKKSDMTVDDAPLYIIASASCYPAFPVKKIGEDSYIDGGYSDNVPINLAIELGATEIVVVDLNAVGRKRKVKTDGVKITRIEPRNSIASFLVFNEEMSKKAIKYGYNDTLKVFGKLEGNHFTFYLNQLKKEYMRNGEKTKEAIQKKLSGTDLFYDPLLKISIFHKLKEDKTGEKREAFFYELIELIGKSFKVDDTKIYKMKNFLQEVSKKLWNTEVIDLKKIEEKIKNKDVRSLFGTSIIMRYLYDRTNSFPQSKHLKKEYCRYALLFPKEFIAVTYLHVVMGENYENSK